MRALHASALALLLAAATPAGAQRLDYVWPGFGEEAIASPSPVQPGARSGPRLHYVILDRLEWVPDGGSDGYAWDVSLLWGGERDRLWLSSVGEGSLPGAPDYLEFQALYARRVAEGLDLNAGLRWDARPAPHRFYFAAGGQWEREFGEHDLWFGAFTYLSHRGELSARLGGIYNHRLAPRLYAQPSFELNASADDVPALGLGRGLSYAEAGLRIRYEIADAFAPYVGVSWERSLGRTARFAREAGDDPQSESLVFGVRSAF